MLFRIMWAPGRIPSDTVCDSLASTIDLLPTIAALTSTPLPDDRSIDGVDISSLLFGSASDLYVTLNRRSRDIRQSAQVVLAHYHENDFVIRLIEINCVGSM